MDPFNPWPEWWTITPVLAEHGHRLIGALVGLLTLVLSVWTVLDEPRRWVRAAALVALVLVVTQGVLGGLRVVLISLNLAVVHASVAQLFFSTLVLLGAFTSAGWESEAQPGSRPRPVSRLARLLWATVTALFVQIVLGALLRHPGAGIDLMLASLHLFWAFVVIGLVLVAAFVTRSRCRQVSQLRLGSTAAVALLGVQIVLGVTALFVLLDEAGVTRPSTLQVIVNSAHMVVGALLMGTTVFLAAWATRLQSVPAPSTR
jgi:cytochrome c oxidase assembly protein subunit 15